jgi:hypothetical protein
VQLASISSCLNHYTNCLPTVVYCTQSVAQRQSRIICSRGKGSGEKEANIRIETASMTTLRPFRMEDLFKFNNINLDVLTETYNMPFYMSYMSKWPEAFTGKSTCSSKKNILPSLVPANYWPCSTVPPRHTPLHSRGSPRWVAHGLHAGKSRR